VIPIKDVVPPRSAPRVVRGLLLLGAIEFVVERWLDGPSRQSIVGFLASCGAFWLFADNVEDRLGRGGLIACYLLCGVVGALAAALASPWLPFPILMSSGAVAGILGAYFVLYPRSRVLTLCPLPFDLFEVPAVFFLCTFIILQLPDGIGAVIEVAAGLIAGAALCVALRRPVEW
jgi:membrane associated rhomboid family serine protease